MSTAPSRKRAADDKNAAVTAAAALLKRRAGAMATIKRRATSVQCATCPSLAPCPSCAANEMCQLSVPPSCAQCPKNACVINPSYGHGHTSPASVGGAVGGVMAALALAGVLFMFWRKRHQRAKAAVRRARAEAKVRMASEKFRPGGGGNAKGRILGADAKGNGNDQLVEDPFKDHHSATPDVEEEDNNSADVEWTELREDGLTTFRSKPGQEKSGGGENNNGAAATFKRHSMGAATHLSRITEGAEDEEEQDGDTSRRHRSLIIRDTIIEEPELNRVQSTTRGHTSSASIGSEQNQARSRRSYGGRELSNPFADWSDVGSFLSGRSSTAGPLSTEGSTAVCSSALEHSKWSMPTIVLEPPSRAHRAVGAPIVDLQGKPKNSQRSPATRTAVLPPSRPSRQPDLNLRLEDGVEPGKVGEDLIKPRKPLGALNGNVSGPTSPSSTSTSMFVKQQQGTVEEIEAREATDFPSELAKSDVYHKRGVAKADDRRMSALTNRSAESLDTLGTFEYVMSAPQIVTPLASDGAKRMQLKQGKAQLVRSLSAVRREQEEQQRAKATKSVASTSTHDHAGASLLDDNPFSDVHSAVGSAHSVVSVDSNGQKTADSLSPYVGQRILSQSGVSIEIAGYDDGGGSRPHSSMSEASLPFVDRPIREPTDRSPTDAHPRGSMATIGSQSGLARYFGASHSSDLDLIGGARSVKHDSDASSLLDPNGIGVAAKGGRHSGASIGGLSVLDEIPFQIGAQTDDDGQDDQAAATTAANYKDSAHVQIAMPDEATDRPSSQASSAVTVEIVSAHVQPPSKQQSSTEFGTENPLLHSLFQADTAKSLSAVHPTRADEDEQPEQSPFHDSNADEDRHLSLNTKRSIEARRTSVPSSLAEGEDVQLDILSDEDEEAIHDENGDDDDGRAPSRQQLAGRTSANPNFEQIRLRHELDNYPFANDP